MFAHLVYLPFRLADNAHYTSTIQALYKHYTSTIQALYKHYTSTMQARGHQATLPGDVCRFQPIELPPT